MPCGREATVKYSYHMDFKETLHRFAQLRQSDEAAEFGYSMALAWIVAQWNQAARDDPWRFQYSEWAVHMHRLLYEHGVALLDRGLSLPFDLDGLYPPAYFEADARSQMDIDRQHREQMQRRMAPRPPPNFEALIDHPPKRRQKRPTKQPETPTEKRSSVAVGVAPECPDTPEPVS